MLLLSIQNYFKFLKWIFKFVAKSCLFVPLFREFNTISISKRCITQFFKLKRCFEVDSIEWFLIIATFILKKMKLFAENIIVKR